MKIKHIVQLLIGIVISAAALYYIFKDISMREMIDSFESFNYWYMIPAFVIFYFGFVVRTWRWQWLFRPGYKVPFKDAGIGMLICFAFNGVFPGRAGEFARAYYVGKKNSTGFSTAFGTVVAERLLDSLTLLPCLVIALMIAPIDKTTHLDVNVFGKDYQLTGAMFMELQSKVIIFAIIMLAGILFVAIPFTRNLMLRVMHAMVFLPKGFRMKIETMLHQFAEGVNFFRNPVRLIGLFALSFLAWATTAVSTMFMAWGFPDMPMNFVEAFALVVITCIFIMLPAAPGYWGFYEAGVIFSVVIMGIHENDSIVRSYAILMHLLQWIPIIAAGMPCAWLAHVSLGDVQKAEEIIEEPETKKETSTV